MARETGNARTGNVRRARHAHLTVRLETGDKLLIRAAAAEMKLSVSEWVRQVAVQEAREQKSWGECQWGEREWTDEPAGGEVTGA